MSRFEALKEAFRRRLLSAADEQLLPPFQRTMRGYEAEISRRRRLLEALSDRDELRSAGLPPDVLLVRTEQQGWSFSHRAEAADGAPRRSEAHSCSVCGKTFSRQLDFKYHVLIHTELKPFKCGVCKRRFRWPGRVRAHRCGLKRARRSPINRRTRPEDGGVRRTSSCAGLTEDPPPHTLWTGATYRRKKVMSDGGNGFHGTGGRRHGDQDTAQNPPVRSEPGPHTQEPPSCQSQDRDQNQERVCGAASLRCSVCAAAFWNRDSLVLHMRSHARPARFTCPVCTTDFVWRRHLTKHMELHQEASGGAASGRQDESDDGDTDDSDFWTESRDAASRRRFGCNECEETFRSRSLLKVHAAAHREQRSQQGEVKEEPEEAQISTSVHLLPVKTEEEEEEEPPCGLNGDPRAACLQPDSSDSVDSDFWKDDRKRPSVTS